MHSKNIEEMKRITAEHIAADAVVKGTYWGSFNNAVGGKGCFIGCLVHSSDAQAVAAKFGLPAPAVKIAEHIFEGLSDDDGVTFFEAVPDAIGRDGKDLNRIHWLFLADTLRNLPPQAGDVKIAVDRVIDGMDLLASGKEWPNAYTARAAANAAANAARAAADAAYAARAAADAAYAARAAADAAYAARAAADAAVNAARAAAYAAADAAADAAYAAADAAYAAADAAYAAADAAARLRQRDTILRLISEA